MSSFLVALSVVAVLSIATMLIELILWHIFDYWVSYFDKAFPIYLGIGAAVFFNLYFSDFDKYIKDGIDKDRGIVEKSISEVDPKKLTAKFKDDILVLKLESGKVIEIKATYIKIHE